MSARWIIVGIAFVLLVLRLGFWLAALVTLIAVLVCKFLAWIVVYFLEMERERVDKENEERTEKLLAEARKQHYLGPIIEANKSIQGK